MKINVSQIRKSPGSSMDFDLEEQLPPVELPGEILAFQGPVKGHFQVLNTGRILHIQGELEAVIELRCSRCLEPFNHRIEATLDEKYCHGTDVKEAEGEEDFRIFEGDLLDLAPEVQETLIIALPMKPICQTDCKGFCPHCGQDMKIALCHCQENKVDPRLEVLKNFFKS